MIDYSVPPVASKERDTMVSVPYNFLPITFSSADMPRNVTVLLNRDLCDKMQPGSRVTVFGYPVTADISSEEGGKAS